MRPLCFCIALLLCYCGQVYSSSESTQTRQQQAIAPYLIPDDHPLKPALDQIFSSSRVTLNTKTFTEAGFEILFVKERSFIRVARHPLLPNHLVKVYFDSEMRQKLNRPGWKWLVDRCKGARRIRKAIEKKKIKHFQVPQKWLYALPDADFPKRMPGLIKQPVILLVEDMHLASEKKNLKSWKKQITKTQLNEFFTIISDARGSSYRPSNVWLSTNGKFSFIDTEYPRVRHGFDWIRPYLSPKMEEYWENLIKSK